MSQSFPRQHRLLCSTDYQRVFKNANRSSGQYFTVLACPTEGHFTRLGLAIARKQLRRAVDRNRIKRMIREHFRQQQATLVNLDYVVMAKSAVRRQTNAVLRAALARHFQQLQQQTQGMTAEDG